MNELIQPRASVTPRTLTTRGARRLAALLALACLPGAARAQEGAPPPPALIRKVVEAYGGRGALGKVRALRQTGQVTATAQGGQVGALVRLLELPASLRVDIAYPGGMRETRIHHERRGHRDGQDVTGTFPHLAIMLQSARLALPFWIASGRAPLRDLGPRERESRELHAVAIDLGRGLEVVAEIDPASGRIVRTIGRMPGPGGAPIEFVNTYSDFAKVGGVLFAMREENFARGVHTGDTLLRRVELLDAAPEGAFDPAAPATPPRAPEPAPAQRPAPPPAGPAVSL